MGVLRGEGEGGVWPAHPPPLSLHTKTVPMCCRVVLQYLFSLTFVATLQAWRHIRSTSPNVLSLFCPTNSANANSVNVSREMVHHTTNSKLAKCFRAAFAVGTSCKTLEWHENGLCLALLDSVVPRRPLGPPHPAKEPLGLPGHHTCRQRRLTDRKEKIKKRETKVLEVMQSQAPNALFNGGWEELRARRGG